MYVHQKLKKVGVAALETNAPSSRVTVRASLSLPRLSYGSLTSHVTFHLMMQSDMSITKVTNVLQSELQVK